MLCFNHVHIARGFLMVTWNPYPSWLGWQCFGRACFMFTGLFNDGLLI